MSLRCSTDPKHKERTTKVKKINQTAAREALAARPYIFEAWPERFEYKPNFINFPESYGQREHEEARRTLVGCPNSDNSTAMVVALEACRAMCCCNNVAAEALLLQALELLGKEKQDLLEKLPSPPIPDVWGPDGHMLVQNSGGEAELVEVNGQRA